jgi:FkbM family methyltransferase
MYWSILGVFDYGMYKSLSVKDRVVVDVGAFVGDSAIYFALRGARKVIAIEPHPEAYKEMLNNIRLNNLENIIVPINAYLVSERGRARLGDYEIKGSVGKHQNYDGEALVVTLNDVIDRYGIGSDAVLKMDCEGCEYDIALNDMHSRIQRGRSQIPRELCRSARSSLPRHI